MLNILESRSVASNNFNDAAAQIHFAFDIDKVGFSRVVIFNQDIQSTRMGRIVQCVVELKPTDYWLYSDRNGKGVLDDWGY